MCCVFATVSSGPRSGPRSDRRRESNKTILPRTPCILGFVIEAMSTGMLQGRSPRRLSYDCFSEEIRFQMNIVF